MKKYTFLAKNPRFVMQGRKITIAGAVKNHCEPNLPNTIVKGEEQGAMQKQAKSA
jgi:hypothetical protein